MNNKVYKSTHIFLGNFVSLIFSPFYGLCNLFRGVHSIDKTEINTILVTEYHRIGDVFIIMSALKSIKNTFPNAKLILVCHESAVSIAKDLKVADEVLSFSAPWTEWSWSIFDWVKARSFAKRLRKKNIDLAFDFKGDFRNAWFLWHTRSKISLGYFTTGGKYFFTHSYKMNQSLHQSLRAEKLTEKAGCKKQSQKNFKWRINKKGSIVLHNGATDKRRTWPVNHWVDLAVLLLKEYQITFVKTSESQDLEKQLRYKRLNVKSFQGDLIEFKNWLYNQRCLIAPDSMAGHLAAYVGIPVFTIFGSQNSNLTHPMSDLGRSIVPDKQCRHKRDHWRLCQFCMESISPIKVNNIVKKQLSRIESQ